MSSEIKVEIISQLSDNYAYIIYSATNKKALVVDPAESRSIINFIKKNNLTLEAILITHNHHDHISGIEGLLNFKDVSVYSPNPQINRTTNLLKNNEILNFHEKKVNPFLCSEENSYNQYMNKNKLTGLSFFTHIRNLKNNF